MSAPAARTSNTEQEEHSTSFIENPHQSQIDMIGLGVSHLSDEEAAKAVQTQAAQSTTTNTASTKAEQTEEKKKPFWKNYKLLALIGLTTSAIISAYPFYLLHSYLTRCKNDDEYGICDVCVKVPSSELDKPELLEAVDVNGDGRNDIITVVRTFTSCAYGDHDEYQIQVLIQNANGAFEADTAETFPIPDSWKSFWNTFDAGRFFFSDINGDGFPDISFISGVWAAGSGLDNNEQDRLRLNMLLNDGKGSFQSSGAADSFDIWRLAFNQNYFRLNLISYGDLNGDGLDDIILAPYYGLDYHEINVILINNGNGTFQDPIYLPRMNGAEIYSYEYVHRITNADINGDGIQDILTIVDSHYREGENSSFMILGWFHLYFGNSDSTYQDPMAVNIPLPNPDNYHRDFDLYTGDIDNDGNEDVIVKFMDWDDQRPYSVLVFLNSKGDGSFEDDPISVGNLPQYDQYNEEAKRHIFLSDMDGDGILDMVLYSYDTYFYDTYISGSRSFLKTKHGVHILLGNGDGSFQDPVRVPCTSIGEYADADDEAPISSRWDDEAVGKRMFTNTLDVADMNNDGKPDLLIGNGRKQKNRVLMNLGDGVSFALDSKTSPWLPYDPAGALEIFDQC